MNEEWKSRWEAAEKRTGELERDLKSQRELHELEGGEWKEKMDQLRKLLRRCNKILEHAPEFPFYLIAKYDIEDLQDELAEEL